MILRGRLGMGRVGLHPSGISYVMEPAGAATRWDGRPLGTDLVGLAWPDSPQPDGVFAAAGEDRAALVPVGRLADFLSAHPRARFVVDLDRPHGLDVADGAVNEVVVESRLYDIGLLWELVRLAAPGITRPLPERPEGPGWVGYSRLLRGEAARLLGHAEETVSRIGAVPISGTRFGPLGIGLDVRGALAAARGGPGVRLSESGLRRVLAVLATRERVARAELRDIPAARSFANTPGGLDSSTGERWGTTQSQLGSSSVRPFAAFGCGTTCPSPHPPI
jgi:hypothetical protein